ncbi:hypothetical protein EX30DRAFT_373796 [Ascodesmis nigricans]|uniref:Zn(2)-C6 fungal-type domain-containing protein n=1 Tax=Ascodesmis nigricans TaxID=341454 RepID=A0A4S2MS52_9PEZI|nr:hypothetical protein EX30DRAFT_373796 [Ascodesmis nigricans]
MSSASQPALPQTPQQQHHRQTPTSATSTITNLGGDVGNVSTDERDEEPPAPLETKRQGVRNPACDHCREKKIRCDRVKPMCLNCRTANAECKYSEPQKRPSDVSRNVHRFQEINQRLDRIEASIAALTNAITAFGKSQLAAVAAAPPARDAPCSCGGPSTTASTGESAPKERPYEAYSSPGEYRQSVPGIIATYVQLKGKSFVKSRDIVSAPEPDTSLYMGSSSIATMTAEAELLTQQKLRANEIELNDKKQKDNGDSKNVDEPDTGPLERLAFISKKVSGLIPYYSHTVLRDDALHFERTIPAREDAMDLVDLYFKSTARVYAIFEETSFRRDMERMYDEPQVAFQDKGWMACFNCVLLFGMHARVVNMNLRERTQLDLSNYSRTILSFYNAWAALDDLNVFITPKLRNVQALVSMAICAIEISRPSLSWSLLVQAARSAQALGLHRRTKPASLTKKEIEERKWVFWQIQHWLSTLSLALGRSSMLPEFECDTELPVDNGDPHFQFFLAYIALSKVQAHMYEGLYSAAASKKTDDELNDTIESLLPELEDWWSDFKHLAHPPSNATIVSAASPAWQKSHSNPNPSPISPTSFASPSSTTSSGSSSTKITHWELFQHLNIHFTYHNSLALILRIAKPTMRCHSPSQLLSAARTSLQVALDVIKAHPDLGSSALPLWLFTCHPFISFFVLFSSIIRNPSSPDSTATDLPLMNRLVTYFTALSKRNEGAGRLLALTSAYNNVAASFMKNYQDAKKRKRNRDDDTGPDLELEDDDTATAIDLAAGMLNIEDATLDPSDDFLLGGSAPGNAAMFSFGFSGASNPNIFPGERNTSISPTNSHTPLYHPFPNPNMYSPATGPMGVGVVPGPGPGGSTTSASPALHDFPTAALMRWNGIDPHPHPVPPSMHLPSAPPQHQHHHHHQPPPTRPPPPPPTLQRRHTQPQPPPNHPPPPPPQMIQHQQLLGTTQHQYHQQYDTLDPNVVQQMMQNQGMVNRGHRSGYGGTWNQAPGEEWFGGGGRGPVAEGR